MDFGVIQSNENSNIERGDMSYFYLHIQDCINVFKALF